MKKLIIRPLRTFFEQQARDYMTAGDLAQVENKIINTIKNKKHLGHDIGTEAAYLKVIKKLKPLFRLQPKVKNSKIIAQINQVLCHEKYAYKKHEHPPRCPDNVFFTNPGDPQGIKTYDIAFYNEASAPDRPAHHTHNEQKSVFYMRCQEFRDTIIIGNMQIDDLGYLGWEDRQLGKVLLQKKNIYSMMVQQALKHALGRGKNEVLFQCGDANEISQWGRQSFKTVKVTKKNYREFYKNYREKMKNFGPVPVKPGDLLLDDCPLYMCSYVLEATANYYKAYTGYRGSFGLLNTLLDYSSGWLRRGVQLSRAQLDEIIQPASHKFINSYYERGYEKMFFRINEFIQLMTGDQIPANQKPAIISKLKIIYSTKTCLQVSMSDILEKLNLDHFFLKAFPELAKLNLRPSNMAGDSEAIYYNRADRQAIHISVKNKHKPPVLGQEYLTPINDPYNINFKQSPAPVGRAQAQIYNWYERILPQEFKKHNIKYDRIEIKTLKDKKEKIAHAWKITAGTENFKSTPLTAF